MSFPQSLDEIPTDKLIVELARRKSEVAAGLCSYCGRTPGERPCKFPERHRLNEPFNGLAEPQPGLIAPSMVEASVREALLNTVRVGVGIVFENADKDRCLVLRDKETGLRQHPGGRVDPGEQPLDTIIRETNEEIGFTVSPNDLTLVFSTNHTSDDGAWWFGLWYQYHGQIRPACLLEPVEDKHDKVMWLQWEDIIAMGCRPAVKLYFENVVIPRRDATNH